MINKTILFHIMFYLIVFRVNSIYSQKNHWSKNNHNKKTAISEFDNVIFKVELMDSIYKYFDTVKIKYEVLNKREDTIIIFDPHFIYWRPISYTKWDKDNCQYVYLLGGTWCYNPGWDHSCLIVKLSKGQTFSFEFKLLIEKEEIDSVCTNGLDYGSKDLEIIKSRMITFFTAFIPITKDFEIKQYEDGYWDFPTTQSGFFFDGNLRRLNLGPLWFRVKK